MESKKTINDLKRKTMHKEKYIEEVIYVTGGQLINTIKRLLRNSSLIQLTILRNNKTIISIPITLSMVAFYLYPFISSFAMFYFINNKFTIKILRLNF